MGIRDYRYVRNVMIVGCPKCGMPIRVETSINTPDAQTVYSEPTMQYCKVPCSVIRDIGLSLYARLVYAELALNAWNGNVACIGQRLIAERLGISQKVVSKSIQELCKRKHVERRDNGKGHRAHTKLLSPIYLWKKGENGPKDHADEPSATNAGDRAETGGQADARIRLPENADADGMAVELCASGVRG